MYKVENFIIPFDTKKENNKRLHKGLQEIANYAKENTKNNLVKFIYAFNQTTNKVNAYLFIKKQVKDNITDMHNLYIFQECKNLCLGIINSDNI